MKYVRDHINEKFTLDTDPIKDMGIGFKDTINITEEDINYRTIAKEEINKILKKLRTRKTNYLRKKLIGKKITGRFGLMPQRSVSSYYGYTKLYSNKTIFVKKIRVFYSTNNERIWKIYIYSRKGSIYQMFDHQNYKITI